MGGEIIGFLGIPEFDAHEICVLVEIVHVGLLLLHLMKHMEDEKPSIDIGIDLLP